MDFSQLNKQRAKSFNDQKALIKKLSQGRTVICPHCELPISLTLNQHAQRSAIARCQTGCTLIELDLM
ncbi:hypothetical protein HUZ36_19915 [Pseudoalteromonas sp. McH1-7]|uniref:Uncharacterized protein n=1 Tax=Pseudoalteromonas peptidolytica F12-50-A1 TaxID=1315280 RepID=A0A8I0T5Y8_9GAMM|nr:MULTISPECIES: hypothetical protein [Pseudoalteromonas]MBE0347763.1 hypothetical protein [Pseudoalteromonas peptidolytica F12-50-A1]MDW7551490.1 hypothetical protein [Pseudoalteromonas peptidolytica]NLR16849.1 hypothetical protein [Pseudoalteromonas peptidolytica]NUZ13048.1 hypothetical protein [Pseudoalteromonas sp. McH1-7]RRS07241.1 hypothetical protein EAG18_17890 [Pseudoalteromonas sp. J010]